MLQLKAKIVSNKNIKGKYFHCVLDAPELAKQALPGQFLEIKVAEGLEPLLRRPISIHRVDNGKIELLYEVVGVGSEKLSVRKSGEELDIIGPLGNGFGLQSQVTSQKLQVLVAGGMGTAPLLFLAEKLSQVRSYKPQVLVLIGAKNKDQILCVDEFKRLGCEVKVATDDGSCGFKGKVTELLKDALLVTGDLRLAAIYACGPRPMLKRISEISKEFDCPAQISLEEHMACGIGACLGCVVKTHSAQRTAHSDFVYKRVCKEGPVFDAQEIIWEA